MQNILFIDDDTNFLSGLRRMLHREDAGWALYFALSVDEALGLVETENIDLVICDILMPEKTGFDLLSFLKQDVKTEQIPVVMLTGLIDSKLKLKALNMGASDLLSKPVEKPELLARITNSLKLKAYHDKILEQNFLLEKKIEREKRYGVMTAEIGACFARGAGLQVMARQCCQSIVNHMGAAFARIWVMDEGKNRLELKASAGMYTHIDGGHQFVPVGQFKIGRIARDRKAHLTNSVIGDPQVSDQEWAVREKMIAFAGHPLIVGDKLVGVVAMFAKHILENSALDALASVTDEIALGIDRKRTADKAHFYALHDSLTHLPNRQHFLDFIDTTIRYADRYEKKFAVVLIDLDNFNRINESLGHIAGDQCLKIVAERLVNCLRSSDSLASFSSEESSLARMGGDEFVVLMQNINDLYEISHAVQRLLEEFSRPMQVGRRDLVVSSSIGIAVFPEDGRDPDALLKNTEIALYHAKKEGKNDFAFYSESMNKGSLKILEMESSLRKAVNNEAFQLYYQPKIRLSDKRIIGAEALIRWEIEEGKFIPPSEFIPLAEKSGLIIPIGNWTLDTACKASLKWQNLGIDNAFIAINVSAIQLGQDDLADKVMSTLEKWSVSPTNIELEITETTIMSDPEKAIKSLDRLKRLGMRIAIDDFGTGYSSLSYLQKLPIDYVKIDVSFIRSILSNPNDAVMVNTMITMAHNLNLKVIAEGVEEDEQMELLERLGCDIVQGYLLGRPLPEHEFLDLFN